LWCLINSTIQSNGESTTEEGGESETNAPATTEAPSTEEQPIEVDQTALQQLTDMGFKEERAKKALLLNRYSVNSLLVY
jgi:uncharacterized UBP type Zn finger protein